MAQPFSILANALFLASVILSAATANANPQSSACVGPPGAPVATIYMHGWFPKSGNGGYVKLEEDNRELLKKMAFAQGIRIAIPLTENFKCSKLKYTDPKTGLCVPGAKEGINVRTWGAYGPTKNRHAGSDVHAIERKAMQACGVTSLAKKRSLICFSDGAYQCQRIANSNCDSLGAYSKVLAIGGVGVEGGGLQDGQTRRNPNCHKLTAIHREPNPKGHHRLFESDLNGVIPEVKTVADSPPTPDDTTPMAIPPIQRPAVRAAPVTAAPVSPPPVAPPKLQKAEQSPFGGVPVILTSGPGSTN